MQKTSKLLWSMVAGMSAVVCFGGLDANAAGRSMVSGSSEVARAGVNTMRMPTMPTMSVNTIGNVGTSGVTLPVSPDVTPTPAPAPTPTNCPDGGPVESEYTVDMCMEALTSCVQGGALPRGLNDMYNEDLRNSIINGMGLCAADVDKCIREVRIDCHKVYDSSADVWIDFNSRVVQPEYYNFVLRRTGLTPNQAENVCGLLDKNTYGKSFAAVSASGNVTSEYNQTINAYNGNGGNKANPVGPNENTTGNGNIAGVDGERGHYARWDATNAACQIRVAAYNKDKLITNNWLFGALGDDKAAEVWQDAGSTFTCNKDLFDFSLLNNTSTVAVVGMGGGTLVGAGIGALSGHGARELDCSNASARSEMLKQIKDDPKIETILNSYLIENVPSTSMSEEQCKMVQDLYNAYALSKKAVSVATKDTKLCFAQLEGKDVQQLKCDENRQIKFGDDVLSVLGKYNKENDSFECQKDQNNRCLAKLGSGDVSFDSEDNAKDVYDCVMLCEAYGKLENIDPHFKTLKFRGTNSDGRDFGELVKDALCVGGVNTCVEKKTIESQHRELDKVFETVTIVKGQESNRLKTTLVGGGIGLAAGGVATAITAFVERNNISCHVGDGLESVGFGKSFTIGSLKDYYVKWNLRVADSISPTAKVTSCQDWIDTCGMYTTAEECKAVVINYQRPGRNTTLPVQSACKMAGSVCIENRPVAVSYGACSRTGVVNQ